MEIDGDAQSSTGNWMDAMHGSGKYLSPPLPLLALCNALLFASVSSDNWILLTWRSIYGNYRTLW